MAIKHLVPMEADIQFHVDNTTIVAIVEIDIRPAMIDKHKLNVSSLSAVD